MPMQGRPHGFGPGSRKAQCPWTLAMPLLHCCAGWSHAAQCSIPDLCAGLARVPSTTEDQVWKVAAHHTAAGDILVTLAGTQWHCDTATLPPLGGCNTGVLRGGLATASVPLFLWTTNSETRHLGGAQETAEGLMVPHDAERVAEWCTHLLTEVLGHAMPAHTYDGAAGSWLSSSPAVAGKGIPISPTYVSPSPQATRLASCDQIAVSVSSCCVQCRCRGWVYLCRYLYVITDLRSKLMRRFSQTHGGSP